MSSEDIDTSSSKKKSPVRVPRVSPVQREGSGTLSLKPQHTELEEPGSTQKLPLPQLSELPVLVPGDGEGDSPLQVQHHVVIYDDVAGNASADADASKSSTSSEQLQPSPARDSEVRRPEDWEM